MESNKEKALTAKEIAETKFLERDYVEAKKHAEKAKYLYPCLDFISVFITIIEIYCCKERIEQDQSDWPEVLRIKKTATMSKKCGSYRKLCDVVRAGRYNVAGVEGALQILSEAFCNVTKTFWTKCSSCHFQFQFKNARINTQLGCFNCGASYIAVPLPSGNHPTNQRIMSYFIPSQAASQATTQDTSHHGASAVLAFGATSGKNGRSKRSKKIKKDDGESSKLGDAGAESLD